MPTRSRSERRRAKGGRAARAAAAAPGATPRRSRSLLARIPPWCWPLLAPLALVVLLWACRGAPLGTAAVDDYSFLHWLRFRHPLDAFDSMGASYYWRPLSRQVYYLAVGPWLLGHAWGAALLHGVLLLAQFALLYRSARRGFEPPLAALIASVPLASESSRVLLGWPSAAQHLLALVAIAAALHEALAGRKLTAVLAAVAAVLCHDAAAPVLAALPAVAWLRTRQARETLVWAGLSLAVVILWGVGYAIARHHGVILPPSAAQGHFPWHDVPSLLRRGLVASLNLEDVTGPRLSFFASLYGVLIAAGVVLAMGAAARARARHSAPVIVGAFAWFVLGSLPLALVLPDWNAWRASIPMLGLGVALTAGLGAVHPNLAVAFTALRLVTLAYAAPAPRLVPIPAPPTASHMSFVRLSRLQLSVDGARAALLKRFPTIPQGGAIRYWSMPLLTEIAFQGARAAQVWYHDSTLAWSKFGGAAGLDQRVDAVVEFEPGHPQLVHIVEPRAFDLMRDGIVAFNAGRWHQADSFFVASSQAQPEGAYQFQATIVRNRARTAYNLNDFAAAESLSALDYQWVGETPGYWSMEARLRAHRRDIDGARRAIERCLMLEPGNLDGVQVARALGMVPK